MVMPETTASEPNRWEALVCASSELPISGESIVREVSGRRIAIFNVAGTLYAIDDLCTHAQSSLSSEGSLQGTVVECALHRAQFDITTGRVLCGPTRKHLKSYELRTAAVGIIAVEKPKLSNGTAS
jgi:nitrite reductase/ring-hydroxylating ferredoxin subunit